MSQIHIDEVEITPIRPKNGLVGFVSFVLNGEFYVGNVALYTRLAGGYRLVWPTRRVGDKDLPLIHPINKQSAELVESVVTEKYNTLMGGEIL